VVRWLYDNDYTNDKAIRGISEDDLKNIRKELKHAGIKPGVISQFATELKDHGIPITSSIHHEDFFKPEY